MGLIAPLFLAGLAALSLPLLFHLIRRTPRGRQVFSSLMFLAPSPPRLTRRSRIDHLLLLLLRIAALALLAFAFSRPFLREAAALRLDDLPRRRVAIVVDNSASMRRSNLWSQTVRTVEKVVGDLGPQDDVALFAFNDRLHTVVNFESDSSEQTRNKADLVRQQMRALAPSWGATDLGGALVAVASELDVANDIRKTVAEPHLVLVSDLQRGARIEALQAYDWPDTLRLEAHVLSPMEASNASLQLLVDQELAEAGEPRVRLASAANSTADQFYLRWAGGAADSKTDKDDIATYVPPGQSRVVRLPRPAGNLTASRIVLQGDECEFDNVYYVVPPRQQNVELVYLGSDAADDSKGMLYYLQLALAGDSLRKVSVAPHSEGRLAPTKAESNSQLPQIAVVSQSVSPQQREELSRYLDRGGTLLAAPKDRDAVTSLTWLFDDLELSEEKESVSGKYLMLGEIDFTHPLFVAFANSPYSDFTKIHFWKHRPVGLKAPATSRVVARFDNGHPAILERSVGQGRAYLLTSGWHPEDSQLALSSKFVPLMHALLDQASGGELAVTAVTVHQSVPLPETSAEQFLTVQKPDKTSVSLAAGTKTFAGTDQPGLYKIQRAGIQGGHEEFQFAVNLASSESNTAPLELEQFEQLGVQLGKHVTRAEKIKQMRQQRDTELESRQKLWRWLIVAALGVLIVETWIAGRAARQIAPMEAVP